MDRGLLRAGQDRENQFSLKPSCMTAISEADMEKPNILIIMTDQLNGTLFPDGRPAPFLHVPHLNALADRSVCFARNYTASPLCGPGGRPSCLASCLHEQASLIMLQNFHQRFLPMHITFVVRAGSVAYRERCILWVQISCMGSKTVSRQISIRLISAGHLITQNQVNGLIGGIII